MAGREEFTERYVRAILDLAQDVKVILSILDDPDVADSGRAAACGALFSLLSTGDLIPDTWGPLGWLDDAVTLRLAAREALHGPDGIPPRYAERYPTFFENLEPDLASAREMFGDTFALFEERMTRLGLVGHKGRRPAEILDSDEARSWLFEEVETATTDLDFEESGLNGAMRRLDSVVAHLRRRLMHR
jgi:uncharacterized membrane protein YkvA (DUF1232 family)